MKGISNFKYGLNAYKYLFQTSIEEDKSYVIYLVLSSIVKSINPIIIVMFPKIIIDSITLGKTHTETIRYIIGFGMLILIAKVFEYLIDYKKDTKLFSMKQILTKKLYDRATSIDFQCLENIDELNNLARAKLAINGDEQIDLLGSVRGVDAFGEEFVNILSAIYKMVWFITVLLSLNSLVVLVILTVVLNAIFNMKEKNIEYINEIKSIPIIRRRSYSSSVMHNTEKAKEIRMLQISDYLVTKYRKSFSEYIQIRFKSLAKILRLKVGVHLVSSFRELIMYIVLIGSFASGHITIGEFVLYLASVRGLSNVLGDFLYSFVNVNKYSGYMKDYIKFISNHDSSDTEQLSGIDDLEFLRPKKIEFKDVWFRYEDATDYSLKGINLVIRAGEKVSIVGENGSGKSTLIKLITNLYKPTKGVIYIDDIDVNDIPSNELNRMMSVVFQDYNVFGFTIKENILVNQEKEANLPEIIKEVGLTKKIEELPNRYETWLSKQYDETGTELSEGQKQKIAIARSLCKNSGVIIFDEPTSALDPISEEYFYKSYLKKTRDRTSVLISHRLVFSSFCDNIIVLEDGKIIESGSFNELSSDINSKYSKMYVMQRETYTKVGGSN